MSHIQGINWQIIHELLLAEMERVNAGTSVYGGSSASKLWILDELNRMNDIAVGQAEEQS